MTETGGTTKPSFLKMHGWRLVRMVVLYPVVIIGLAVWLSSLLKPGKMGGLEVGEAAPAIAAPLWINGDAPETAGKVVLVDAWAWWCGPCRRMAPELVALHEKFAPRGVVFVGVSPSPEEEVDKGEKFIAATNIGWPSAYEAEALLVKLKCQGFPSVWVVGRDGRIVWNLDSPEPLEQALERALSETREPSRSGPPGGAQTGPGANVLSARNDRHAD